ncbi:hypothetical protein CYMTET_34895 [Cymbomonas tetramitiformis]|uniref:Uncharacterized protein n=1 Tax=Cymbomonas tetramitiformis TaxID=36881 RepID=A0AAE0KPR6_9CHLO|nr:hypothetical protein CYMTET_34895 [Cymbomonas tetramitiformis]|eukprot:gene17356-biopygen17920
MALTETARDAEYDCYNLLSKITMVETPMPLNGDKHASVYQAENAMNNTATRHVTVRYRYASSLVEAGRIVIAKVPSLQNVVEFFIKSLAVDRFRTLARIIIRGFSASVEE